MNELYEKEHFDAPYFQSLKDWLSTQTFMRGVEIGLAWAMSTSAYLETQNSKLVTIDLDDKMGKSEAIKKVYGDRWELMLGDSSTLLSKLSGKFDYIYIDGDHDYAGVKKDLEAAHLKLDKGGVIVCDDYGNPCGVKKAVDEFCKAKKYSLESMPQNPNGGVILRRKDA